MGLFPEVDAHNYILLIRVYTSRFVCFATHTYPTTFIQTMFIIECPLLCPLHSQGYEIKIPTWKNSFHQTVFAEVIKYILILSIHQYKHMCHTHILDIRRSSGLYDSLSSNIPFPVVGVQPAQTKQNKGESQDYTNLKDTFGAWRAL